MPEVLILKMLFRQDAGERSREPMALKAVVDSLDGVSPELASLYTQQDDGRYLLQVEPVGGYALEDVAGLKSALSSSREASRKDRLEKNELKDRLLAFGDFEPEQVRDALTELEELKKADPKQLADRQVASVKESLEKQFGKKVSELQEKLDATVAQLKTTLVESEAVKAINAKKGVVELLLPHVKQSVDVREVDGKYQRFVIGPDGNPRMSLRSGSTDPMDLEELVEEMSAKDVYKPAFLGAGASGGGATGGGNHTGRGGDNSDLEKLDPVSQLHEARRRGLVKPRS